MTILKGADLNDGQGLYPTRTILKGVAFGILEPKEKFQKWDTSSSLAFINVLYKGY
jgi:hypothetical protein